MKRFLNVKLQQVSWFYDDVSSRAAMKELFSFIFAGWLDEWMNEWPIVQVRLEAINNRVMTFIQCGWPGWQNYARERDEHY